MFVFGINIGISSIAVILSIAAKEGHIHLRHFVTIRAFPIEKVHQHKIFF